MDVNDLRTLLMLAALIAFVGITAWAYSTRAARGFEEAARLPFADEEADTACGPDTERRRP